jgi:hypothetical protein
MIMGLQDESTADKIGKSLREGLSKFGGGRKSLADFQRDSY